MLKRRILLAAVMSAALVASLLALPAVVSAQSTGAYLDGAEPWTESDCAGEVPIVVGSDAKAQSDIYSAVTLAGVVDTDCVVLAGPRDGNMPADQQTRLDAAATGGYVLGGTAAVPEANVAGRNLTRLGGATRWETAQLIGSQARALAEGQQPGAPSAPDTTLPAPTDVQQPRVFLHGAEPWIASDCAGDVPIVVGSDAKAQSDIYSAVTLAGVVGTDCVVLAGPRNGDMPASQRTRLAAAEPGGYVLGGIAAVPTAKITGRDMTRLGGNTRWDTAQLVGRRASGDTTAGTSTTTESASASDAVDSTSARFRAVSAGHAPYTCGIRADGTLTCWGSNERGKAEPPAGRFTAVSTGKSHSCALRADGTLACWGRDTFSHRQPVVLPGEFSVVAVGDSSTCVLDNDGSLACWSWNNAGYNTVLGQSAPPGRFSQLSLGSQRLVHSTLEYACGVRTDGEVACWGANHYGQADAPSGKFTAVSAGTNLSCGIRADGSIDCWGDDRWGQTGAPSGRYSTISVGEGYSCGVRDSGPIDCWGVNSYGRTDAPSGRFTAVSAGQQHACGLRTDGTLTCWGENHQGQALVPSGNFTAVSLWCGLRADGEPVCWGDSRLEQAELPSGSLISISAGPSHACGLRADGSIACWGNNFSGQADAPAGRFSAVSVAGGLSCGVRVAGSIVCWGYWGEVPTRDTDAPSGRFTAVSVGVEGSVHACGLRVNGSVACWGSNELGKAKPPSGRFVAVSAGGSHSCGLRADGEVTCWGDGRLGQRNAPSGPFTAVSAGRFHSCELRNDGSVVCWGSNEGHGGGGQTDAPSGRFTSVSSWQYFSCGLRTDGSAVCWGDTEVFLPSH